MVILMPNYCKVSNFNFFFFLVCNERRMIWGLVGVVCIGKNFSFTCQFKLIIQSLYTMLCVFRQLWDELTLLMEFSSVNIAYQKCKRFSNEKLKSIYVEYNYY